MRVNLTVGRFDDGLAEDPVLTSSPSSPDQSSRSLIPSSRSESSSTNSLVPPSSSSSQSSPSISSSSSSPLSSSSSSSIPTSSPSRSRSSTARQTSSFTFNGASPYALDLSRDRSSVSIDRSSLAAERALTSRARSRRSSFFLIPTKVGCWVVAIFRILIRYWVILVTLCLHLWIVKLGQ